MPDTKVKLIIAGDRDFTAYTALREAFEEFMEPYAPHEVTIICGMAIGADLMGRQIAKAYSLRVIEMPPDRSNHDKATSAIRNEKMAQIATHLLLAWDGKSKGSANMLSQAQVHNLHIEILNY